MYYFVQSKTREKSLCDFVKILKNRRICDNEAQNSPGSFAWKYVLYVGSLPVCAKHMCSYSGHASRCLIFFPFAAWQAHRIASLEPHVLHFQVRLGNTGDTLPSGGYYGWILSRHPLTIIFLIARLLSIILFLHLMSELGKGTYLVFGLVDLIASFVCRLGKVKRVFSLGPPESARSIQTS